MRTVDAKDFETWLALRKSESFSAFLERWKARAWRRRQIAMWVVFLLAFGVWAIYTSHHAYPLLVRHLGVPGGRMVPDLNPILAGNAYRPAWKAAALRLCDLGPRGVPALPVIEARLADPRARSDNWLLVYAATRMGDDAIGVLARASMDENKQIAHLARPHFDEYPLDRQVPAMLPVLVPPDGYAEPRRVTVVENAAAWFGAVGPNADADSLAGMPLDRLDVPPAAAARIDEDTAARVAQAVAPLLAVRNIRDFNVPAAMFRLGEAATDPTCDVLRQQLDLLERYDEMSPLERGSASRARGRCYRVLHALGPRARAAAPLLTEAVEKESRRQTAHGALDALLAVEPEGEHREQAVQMLSRLGFNRAFHELAGPAAVPELIEDLNSRDETVRTRTMQTLGRIGPAAEAALPALREALSDDLLRIRIPAARAFHQVGGPLDEALAALRDAMSVAIPHWRIDLAEVFCELGGPLDDALPVLRDTMSDEQPHIRIRAARVFWQVGGPPDEALPVLREIMTDESIDANARSAAHLRATAALVFYQAGGPLNEVLQTLADLLELGPVKAPYTVPEVLEEIGAPAQPLVPPLLDWLRADEYEPHIRVRAINALAQIDRESEQVTAALLHVAEHDASPKVRGAAFAQVKSRPGAFRPFQSIEEALHALGRSERDSVDSWRAVETLHQYGDEIAIPVAERLVASDIGSGDRARLTSLLAELGPGARPAVPVLAEAAADPSHENWVAAVTALEALGPVARDAVPALLPEMETSWNRQNALKAIDPAAYVAWRHNATPARIILGGALALAVLLMFVIRRSRSGGAVGASGSAGTDAPYDGPLEHPTLASTHGQRDGQA